MKTGWDFGITLVTYGTVLTIVLFNTATNFDETELMAITAMLIGGGSVEGLRKFIQGRKK